MAHQLTSIHHRLIPKLGLGNLFRKLVFRSVAVVLGLFVGFVCAEIGFRVLNIRPERYAPPRYLVLDNGVYSESDPRGDFRIKRRSRFENLGVGMGEYVPGSRFKAVYATNPRGYFDFQNGVPFQINTLGLRGPEISANKPPGTFRILVLGDSFAFGAGVRDEETFVRRLEKSLNKEEPTCKSVEVLNAGVEGYNTRDEVIYLEHQWLELDPDLVLIAFYLNDAYPDRTFAATIHGLDLGVSLTQPSGLARCSYVWDYAQHEWHTVQLRRKVDEFYTRPYFSHPKEYLEKPDEVQVDWSTCRKALERAMYLSRTRGIKIALIAFPEFYKLDRGYPFEKIHRLVMETCESLSLPACDLLQVYRGMRADRLWVHITDHHPNELAHELAAQAIEEFLDARALGPLKRHSQSVLGLE